jgi:hypothetical protein
LGVADNLKAAASILGIDYGLVQFARNKGCQAFKDSRVRLAELEKWIADNQELINSRPKVTKEEIDIKLKELKYERDTQAKEREKFNFDVERGKYWKKEEVSSELRQIEAHRKGVLQRKLLSELPPKLLGLDVTGITEQIESAFSEVCQIFHDRTRKWH